MNDEELVKLPQRTHCIALTQVMSREEFEKMYPPAKAAEIHERVLDFIALWFGIERNEAKDSQDS